MSKKKTRNKLSKLFLRDFSYNVTKKYQSDCDNWKLVFGDKKPDFEGTRITKILKQEILIDG